jgi:hypothetical protein
MPGEEAMRHINTPPLRAAVLAAAITVTAGLATTAAAQDSVWGYFEENGLLQAGVQNADGRQLILKCNETGDRKVFARVYSPVAIAPPGLRPVARDVVLRFDDRAPETRRWNYEQFTAEAIHTTRIRELPNFVTQLADASTLRVRVDPVDGTPQNIDFTVTGAREAIRRVLESCQDSSVDLPPAAG